MVALAVLGSRGRAWNDSAEFNCRGLPSGREEFAVSSASCGDRCNVVVGVSEAVAAPLPLLLLLPLIVPESN
jgi:hypothetical protein